jgi:hypothetical protein
MYVLCNVCTICVLLLHQIVDDDVDDPDLSLRLSEGLREHTGGEIKTVVASAADANIYRSAAAFEDIITDPNLLKVSVNYAAVKRVGRVYQQLQRLWTGVLIYQHPVQWPCALNHLLLVVCINPSVPSSFPVRRGSGAARGSWALSTAF